MKKVFIILLLIFCFCENVLADSATPRPKNIEEIEEEYSLENSDVVAITPTKAVITNPFGLAMYTGPNSRVNKKSTSTTTYTYKKILTIPQNGVVTLTHKVEDTSETKIGNKSYVSSTLWYYASYEGKKGWIQYNKSTMELKDEEIVENPTPVQPQQEEQKDPVPVQPQQEEQKDPIPVQPKDDTAKSNTEMILLCLLASIFGALVCLILILLANRKKSNANNYFNGNN